MTKEDIVNEVHRLAEELYGSVDDSPIVDIYDNVAGAPNTVVVTGFWRDKIDSKGLATALEQASEHVCVAWTDEYTVCDDCGQVAVGLVPQHYFDKLEFVHSEHGAICLDCFQCDPEDVLDFYSTSRGMLSLDDYHFGGAEQRDKILAENDYELYREFDDVHTLGQAKQGIPGSKRVIQVNISDWEYQLWMYVDDMPKRATGHVGEDFYAGT